MKILFASDVHGSKFYAQKVCERFEEEKADLLVLLGDIYNHGPRNPLPKDYDPMGVSQLFNSKIDKLIVVKGNCDSDVDTLISDFEFVSEFVVLVDGKKIFLQHGDKFNKDNLPKGNYDAFNYGQFHTGFIEKREKIVVANAGSVSLPKNDTANSYIVYEKGKLILKDIDGVVIKSENI